MRLSGQRRNCSHLQLALVSRKTCKGADCKTKVCSLRPSFTTTILSNHSVRPWRSTYKTAYGHASICFVDRNQAEEWSREVWREVWREVLCESLRQSIISPHSTGRNSTRFFYTLIVSFSPIRSFSSRLLLHQLVIKTLHPLRVRLV